MCFELSIQVERTNLLDDDTALNAIKLYCRNHHGYTGSVISSHTDFGEWTDGEYCVQGYINGYNLRVS